MVDPDGRRRTGRRVDRVMEMLTWSPDGGDTPASSMIEDALCDYLLDGNALLVPMLDAQGYPVQHAADAAVGLRHHERQGLAATCTA